MRTVRNLCLVNNDLYLGLFGVDVDKVIEATRCFTRRNIHNTRNGGRGLFDRMTVNRNNEGEVYLHFPTYKTVPETIFSTIAYNIKTAMQVASEGMEGGPVTGTNYMQHLDDEISFTFPKTWFMSDERRPGFAALNGCTLKITVGYLRALYEILKKRSIDDIEYKYGEDIVEQIRGARYNGFVQNAVAETKVEIEKLKQLIRTTNDELDKQMNAERWEATRKIEEKWRDIKKEKTKEYTDKIAALEKEIQQMTEDCAVGI